MTSARQLTLLAASIFLGVVFPSLAALCQPLLMPTVFLLFVASILQVSFSDATVVALRDRASWVILVWQLLALPLLASILLRPFLGQELYTFAVVSLCSCAITATTALSRILGLNDALALVVGLAGSVMMPIPLYLFMQHVLGVEAVIDLYVYSGRVALFVVLPFVLVYVFRKLVSTQSDVWVRGQMPSFVLLLLVLFGLSVMDGVQALLISDPWLVLSYVLLSFGISFLVQGITWFALRVLGARDATTAALLCAYRNLGIIAAITGSSLGDHFLIFVGIWQLPMYTLPLLLRKYYVRHSPLPV